MMRGWLWCSHWTTHLSLKRFVEVENQSASQLIHTNLNRQSRLNRNHETNLQSGPNREGHIITIFSNYHLMLGYPIVVLVVCGIFSTWIQSRAEILKICTWFHVRRSRFWSISKIVSSKSYRNLINWVKNSVQNQWSFDSWAYEYERFPYQLSIVSACFFIRWIMYTSMMIFTVFLPWTDFDPIWSCKTNTRLFMSDSLISSRATSTLTVSA